MQNNPTPIQKFLQSELSFYITLIGAIFAIAGFYFGITNQINLIALKLDNHLEQTSGLPKSIASLESDVAVLQSKIK